MSRRVAVVFPFALEASHLGKDVLLIPAALRRLGYEPELHVPSAQDGVAWPVPVHVAGAGGLERPEHYLDRGLGSAIVFSFLHFPRMLEAVRRAGLRVIAKGDTTGQSVVRAHPQATLVHALHDQPTRLQRGVSLLHWLARLGPLAGHDARELQRVLEIAHATVVETQAAREAVRAALAKAGAEHLAEKLRVISNPVAEAFTEAEVPVAREPLIVAVGRWDLAAKDASLLARALERFLSQRPDHRAVIVGDGGRGVFGRRCEQVGRLSQEHIVPLLGRARMVVTSSRWESFSLSSHEGLAMGCTVVGPKLQPLLDIESLGFATVANRRSPAGLADALAREAAAWDAGRRDPVVTASFWRPRLAIEAVGRSYAGLFDAGAPSIAKRP